MWKRLQHVLYRSRIPFDCWQQIMSAGEVFLHLGFSEQHRLRKLAGLFLHDKSISGASGFEVDLEKQVYVAAHACLLILNLKLDYFRGWQGIIVYSVSFVIKCLLAPEYTFVEDANLLGTIDDTARKCSLRGKTDKNDTVFFAPQIMF